MSQLGMREFRDVKTTAKFMLPSTVPTNASGCVANRVDQMWHYGVVFCVTVAGDWTLSYGGPALGGFYTPSNVIKTGSIGAVPSGAWHTISLTTDNTVASATCDGKAVVSGVTVRNSDAGFSAIGASSWYAIEFDQPSVEAVGSLWTAPVPDTTFATGQALVAANCTPNGVVDQTQAFLLKPDWLLEHVASGLCAEASGNTNGAALSLQPCKHGKIEQQFRNDYTHIRNGLSSITLGAYGTNGGSPPQLVGNNDGTVKLATDTAHSDWSSWVYFPNTNQLRNQYVANGAVYPQCLAVTK
jgi:hypothetical protein